MGGSQGLTRPIALSLLVFAGVIPARAQIVGPRTLGDEASDLVFFSLAPCRIVDTRISTGAFAGPLQAGTPRSFSHNQDLAAQGGNGAGCGVPTDPASIAVTLLAVSPLGTGNLRAWKFNDPVPRPRRPRTS